MWPKKLSGHTCGPKNFQATCDPENNQATVAQKTIRPLWPRKQSGHCGPENNQATHSTLTDPIFPQQPLAALPFSLELRDSNEHQRIRWRARTIADGDHRRERPALVDEAVVSAIRECAELRRRPPPAELHTGNPNRTR